jgi:hypothetical protein
VRIELVVDLHLRDVANLASGRVAGPTVNERDAIGAVADMGGPALQDGRAADGDALAFAVAEVELLGDLYGARSDKARSDLPDAEAVGTIDVRLGIVGPSGARDD